MYALFNFNNYLGGGETIFTRWADYLNKNNIECRLFYPEKSFIADELKRLHIPAEVLCPYGGDVNYYYQRARDRNHFVDWIYGKLQGLHDVRLVSFCSRDLYTLVDVAKRDVNYTITHLILHDEDNLYVCQTLYDKMLQRYLGRRQFSNTKQIEFNNRLFRELVANGGMIAEKMTTKIVMSKYGIEIDEETIVPPPMCEFEDKVPTVQNNKKIIWLGRVVDFKLPAICAMLDFVCKHKDYSLTIVGDGEIEFLKKYLNERALDSSNVVFKGIVPYNMIGQIIKEHSIGYACGTSIVEIGRFGLPVITALANPKHTLFKRAICGGVYNNKYKGNEGNNLFIGETEDEQPTIEDTIAIIERDFAKAAQQSYMAMKEDFDMVSNLSKYLSIINSSKRLRVENITIPYSSPLRRLFFMHMSS